MGRVWQIEADVHAGLDAELLETGRAAVRKRVELSVGHALVHELQRGLVAETRRRCLQHDLQRRDVERDVRADAFRIGLDPRLSGHRLLGLLVASSGLDLRQLEPQLARSQAPVKRDAEGSLRAEAEGRRIGSSGGSAGLKSRSGHGGLQRWRTRASVRYARWSASAPATAKRSPDASPATSMPWR